MVMSVIVDFQKKHGLTPDGKIGKNTLTKMKEVFNIKSDESLAHFLGQCAHESAGFTAVTENLNYSAQGLLKTFKKYFTPEMAKKYARNPEKIANRVYANRMGNGDEDSGDGYKHRGFGLIQLTGKSNQEAFAKAINKMGIKVVPLLISNPKPKDFDSTEYFGEWDDKQVKDNKDIYNGFGVRKPVNKSNKELPPIKSNIEQMIKNNPRLIATDYPFESAIYFFDVNKIWLYTKKVDRESIIKVSKIINLGNVKSKLTPNGLEDRVKKTLYYYNLLKK